MVDSDTLQRELKKDGYSKEDAYFARVNLSLVERLAERRQEEERRLHLMKCPHCGSQLRSQVLYNATLERCEGCQGVFLEPKVADMLFECQKPKTLWARVKKLFAPKEEEPTLF